MRSLFEPLHRWLTAYMAQAGLTLFCCDGPDTNGQAAAAQANERVGMRSLDLAEQQWAQQSDLQQEFLDIVRANAIGDAELKDLQYDLAAEQADKRRNVFDPLEAGIVLEAENYDSDERISTEASKADAAVIQAYDRVNKARGKDMLRMGVNPNSGKALALRENSAVDLARDAATAGTQAAERIKAKGFGMRMDAAGLGRNLATNQTAAADSASRIGQGTVQSYGAGVDQGNRNFNSTMQGFSTASSAYGNAGRTYGDIAQTELASDPMRQIGSAVGTGIGAYKTCMS